MGCAKTADFVISLGLQKRLFWGMELARAEAAIKEREFGLTRIVRETTGGLTLASFYPIPIAAGRLQTRFDEQETNRSRR